MLTFNATFFIAMVSFVIFMIIMNAILYKPLDRVVKERKELIEGNNYRSKLADEKCETLKEWQKTSLEKAQKSSREMYQKIVSEYKTKKETELNFEKNLSRKEVAIAVAELNNEVISAKQSLDKEVQVLADIITDKVIG